EPVDGRAGIDHAAADAEDARAAAADLTHPAQGARRRGRRRRAAEGADAEADASGLPAAEAREAEEESPPLAPVTEDELSVEATGETVGEAKWSALRELEHRYPGLDKAAVHFEVLSEGQRGLLGVGYAPAHVLAILPAEAVGAAPEVVVSEPRPDESGLAGDVRGLVERIAAGIGVHCRVETLEDAA